MTFLIDYDYGALKNKRIRIKRCKSEFEAKAKLHSYLVRKHGEAELIITQCYNEDGVMGFFGGIFNK